MKCNELKEMWSKYENGDCSEKEQKYIEEHLETCSKCSAYIESKLEEQEENVKSTEAQGELPKSTEYKKTFRKAKWRQRINNAIFIFIIVFVIWFIGSMLSKLYYSEERMEKVRLVETIAIESMIPNVQVKSTSFYRKAFFRADLDMRLDKQVGKEYLPIGNLKNSHLLENPTKSERSWNGGKFEQKLFFLHPNKTTDNSFKDFSDQAWNALEKLPEGTVAEIAISFNQLYTREELDHLFSRQFLDHRQLPLWYALDTGSGEQGPLGTGEIIGVPQNIAFGPSQDKLNHDEKVLKMLEFLSENEEMVSDLNLTYKNYELENKYKYVKKNGVKVFGVVLTGPTKELLKLREMDNIQFITLGEVELWNWFDRPASGALY